MKALHTRIEVDQPDGHAGNADDRQARLVAFALDEPAFLDVDVERIRKNIDGVEADLLGLLNAERRVASGLSPGRIDEAEFHGRNSSDKFVLCPNWSVFYHLDSPLQAARGIQDDS